MKLKQASARNIDSDEEAVRRIPQQMVEAWNRGSSEAFAGPFAAAADFIAFEGSHLVGQKQIAAFHQPLFDTSLKGTRLEGGVRFVHFLNDELALMHAYVGTALAGQPRVSPSRNSMQLFVVTKHGDQWQVAAMMNARQLTMEQQRFSDDFESLTYDAKRKVRALVASLS
jgi:uncharacterized protein (TIGR02246 family)